MDNINWSTELPPNSRFLESSTGRLLLYAGLSDQKNDVGRILKFTEPNSDEIIELNEKEVERIVDL